MNGIRMQIIWANPVTDKKRHQPIPKALAKNTGTLQSNAKVILSFIFKLTGLESYLWIT